MNSIEHRKMSLHEGIVEELLKLILVAPVKRGLKKALKELDNDPEFVAATADLNYHLDRIERLVRSICERDPNHPDCKGKSYKPTAHWKSKSGK